MNTPRPLDLRPALTALFDAVPAPISVLRGMDLVIEYVNPACVAMWQRTASTDLVGRRLVDALPEIRDQEDYVAMLRSVLQTGKPVFRHEAPLLIAGNAGARTSYVDFAYSPMTGSDGKIDGVWVFAFDVTKIVLARRNAEIANRAKDDFLATMSHELRTPLHAMLGWAGLLQTQLDDRAMLARGLAVIERNARTQARIVNDLLDVSRIINGKLLLMMNPMSLHATIAGAIEVIRPAAEQRGVRLLTELSPATDQIVGDAERIQQVVWNLLSNAVRFTSAGGQVRVTARARPDAIVVEIADTGQGIAAEHLPHLFERFHQVDSSTTRAHGGLGLGLALVRHLVEGHGGTVTAASEGPGRGATFTIQLPRQPEAPAEPGAKSARRDGAEHASQLSLEASGHVRTSEAVLDGTRILLVEDDDDSRELMRLYLERAGAIITSVRSAREALAAPGRFDVVVADIGMPEVDGYTYLRELRATGGPGATVYAIALTAFARSEDAERARRAGYHDHVAKPFDAGKLVARIRRYLAGRAAPSAR